MRRACLGPRPGTRCPFGALVSGRSRCQPCQRAAYQFRNVTRDQFARHVYGSAEWKRLSRAVIAEAVRCFYCGATGVVLTGDHVEPIRVAPHRALDETNVVAACRSCQTRRARNPDWRATQGGGWRT
jgi:5-methylcytosine-specific restriction endonuclease McrA